jgi:cell division protein FtsW
MAYKPSSDRTLFITTSFLTLFGLVMVYSASSVMAASQHGMSGYYFLRQLAFAGAGYVCLLFLMNIDYHIWQKDRVVQVLMFVCVVALVLVLIQPKVNGAHRWLRYGSVISFQPSEIAKLVLLLFMGVYLNKHEAEINLPTKGLLPFLAIVLLIAGLIGVEPDLGQAVCVVLITCVLLFIAGVNWNYIGGAFLLAVPAFYFFVMRVPFRWDRIKSFLDPGQDPLGAGWQIIQSLTAVGSGGVWGVGPGASRQKLFFLPEAHSDFIFAVIGEEFGLLGTTLIAAGFLIFFIRGMKISMKAPDRFGFYLGLGITLMVVLQAFINISMVLALMPTKGIALPFISQGGSSLLLNLMATGVLLNVSHYCERA